MRSIPGGYYLYKFNELSNSAKSQAIEESEEELFVLAVTSLKTNDYLLTKKEFLQSKGFSNIQFYRFFVEDKHIRIDFTFDYIITNTTYAVFKKFADSINLRIPSTFANWIKDGILEVTIHSNRYDDIENRDCNIEIKKEIVAENFTINQFMEKIYNTFVSYYEYILTSIYVKIRKDLKRKTNKESFNNFIQNHEYYANGLLYEES